MVVDGRIPALARVDHGHLVLTEIGEIVDREWSRTAALRYEVILGPWVVMPDHFHGLIRIPPHRFVPSESVGLVRHPNTLGSTIAGFKGSSTRLINQLRHSPGERFWQLNYHDRVLRNRAEWNRAARYIKENPIRLLRGF
jgi:REP element-mobilizing transposase RayT